MAEMREKFATQVDAELLSALRALAKTEGRQIQAVVEDALRDHLAAKQHGAAFGRNNVMQAYLRSTKRYSGLYEVLAK